MWPSRVPSSGHWSWVRHPCRIFVLLPTSSVCPTSESQWKTNLECKEVGFYFPAHGFQRHQMFRMQTVFFLCSTTCEIFLPLILRISERIALQRRLQVSDAISRNVIRPVPIDATNILVSDSCRLNVRLWRVTGFLTVSRKLVTSVVHSDTGHSVSYYYKNS
jgi:hypothetical protein